MRSEEPVACYGKKAGEQEKRENEAIHQTEEDTPLQQWEEEKYFEAQENEKGSLTGLF